MTTTSEIRSWLSAVGSGAILVSDNRYFHEGHPVNDGGTKLLRQIVLSGWANRSGCLLKLTVEGEQELEAAR